MTNIFDKGNDPEKRLRYLNEGDNITKVERNLETLLLKHEFAYI